MDGPASQPKLAKPQTPDHGLGCGWAFEKMPHLLGGEPNHLADSAPVEEPTSEHNHVELGQIEAHHARASPDGGEDFFFHQVTGDFSCSILSTFFRKLIFGEKSTEPEECGSAWPHNRGCRKDV